MIYLGQKISKGVVHMAKYEVDFAEVKLQVPIMDGIAMLGLKLKQKGKQFVGDCPFENCKHPDTFKVTPAIDLWHCFGCDQGGDIIELVHLLHKVGKPTAAKWLIGKDEETRSRRTTVPPEEKVEQPPTDLEADHHAVLVAGFELEIAKAVGIGYCRDGEHKGRVVIPVRLPNGQEIGRVSATDFQMPEQWDLPELSKVVRLVPRKKA